MAKRIAPLSPAVRYTHRVTGGTTYDAVSTVAGAARVAEELASNGHTDITPMTVKVIYRGKVVETPCSRCRAVRPDVTRVNDKALCPSC